MVQSLAVSQQTAVCYSAANTAVLVGGLERGFRTQPILWRSLRDTLQSFGGVELFLYLKDLPEENRKGHAAADLAIHPPRDARGGSDAIAALSPVAFAIDANASTVPALLSRINRCGMNPTLSRPSVGFFHTLRQLWRMVAVRERARTARFERVAFLRCDMAHLARMGAHCLYDRAAVHHSMGADCAWRDASAPPSAKCLLFSGLDFWFLAPRRYAAALAGAPTAANERSNAAANPPSLPPPLRSRAPSATGTLDRALQCSYAPSRQRKADASPMRHHPETAIHIFHFEHTSGADHRVLDAAFDEQRERAKNPKNDAHASVGPAVRRAIRALDNMTLRLDGGDVRLIRQPDTFLGAAVIRRVYGRPAARMQGVGAHKEWVEPATVDALLYT